MKYEERKELLIKKDYDYSFDNQSLIEENSWTINLTILSEKASKVFKELPDCEIGNFIAQYCGAIPCIAHGNFKIRICDEIKTIYFHPKNWYDAKGKFIGISSQKPLSIDEMSKPRDY